MNSGGFEAVGYRLAAMGLAALRAVTNATLADNATARDFASLLPLTLTLGGYASTEKIGYPPRKLTNEGAAPPA